MVYVATCHHELLPFIDEKNDKVAGLQQLWSEFS